MKMERHKPTLLLFFLLTVSAAVIAFLLSAAPAALASGHVLSNPEGEAGRGVSPTSPGASPTSPGGEPTSPGGVPTRVSAYLDNLYLWFLGFIGIAALFAFVRGGVTYMFSGANPTLVGEAKKQIWNGILGLLIAAGSYLLLNTINPDLVTHGFNLENIIRGIQ